MLLLFSNMKYIWIYAIIYVYIHTHIQNVSKQSITVL
jgi:hypothetical protein